MWKSVVILIVYLTGTALATPVVGLKKNMEILMSSADDLKTDEKMSSAEEEPVSSAASDKAEIAMTTLNLPSNATSIRADIVDGFSCKNRAYGYYADVENDCQIFHVCMPVVYADGKENTFRWSFICPEETVFSQDSFTCMREEDMSFGCEDSVKFYELNRNFGMVDSSMEMQSNEASAEAQANNNSLMESIMSGKKDEVMTSGTISEDKIEKEEKIQKRVDTDVVSKPEPALPKPSHTHKKKNSVRKSANRKAPTRATIPPKKAAPVVEQPIAVVEEAKPQAPVKNDDAAPVSAKAQEESIAPTTIKFQRFTRRPDLKKEEQKKKVEEAQKPSIVKKPFKTESITMQKRKRPQMPLGLKHKFNGEDKPLKNILKTSEIIKIVPVDSEQAVAAVKLNKKDAARPPIPEPILIRVEEQPAAPSKVETEPKQQQQQKIDLPASVIMPSVVPLVQEPIAVALPALENEAETTAVLNDEPIKEKRGEFAKKEEETPSSVAAAESNAPVNQPAITATEQLKTEPDTMTVISGAENEQTVKVTAEHDRNNFGEKLAGSMTGPKEEQLLQHEDNDNNINSNKIESSNNEAEIIAENNKNSNVDGDDASSANSNQSGLDQQSMIINLISSLVNAENSKPNDAEQHLQQQQQQVVSMPAEQVPQAIVIDDTKSDDSQKSETEEAQQQQQQQESSMNNNEGTEMELLQSVVAPDSDLHQNDQPAVAEIINSNGEPNADEDANNNVADAQNEFNAMHKFFNPQQQQLYNHMTHIPVRLLTDDQIEDIQTKGDLNNPEALNVIQRIEQLLQDEVKEEVAAAEPAEPEIINEAQQSSEEIKPIYQRTVEPVDSFQLKGDAMAIEEPSPVLKDTVEKDAQLNTVTEVIVESEKQDLQKDKDVQKSETSESESVQPIQESVMMQAFKVKNSLEPEASKEAVDTPTVDQLKFEVESSNVAPVAKDQSSDVASMEDAKSESVLAAEPAQAEPVAVETKTDVEKPIETDAASDSAQHTRTSSRSLKHPSRIMDPRKRRFLFKADA